MKTGRESTSLQLIFSLFVGLLITAFVGVGVNTFIPTPTVALERQVQSLVRRQVAIERDRSPAELSTSDREQIQRLRDSVTTLEEVMRVERAQWSQTTSLVLIACATLAMVIAVVRAEQLAILGNGLLLGGVFTMLYGVGVVIAATESTVRFLILTAALGVTLGLGYLRFVRRREPATAPILPADGAEYAASRDALAARVGRLEQQLRDIAKLLTDTPAP